MKSDATFVSANVRLRKKRIGSIGSGVRSSQSTKSAVRTAPPASEPTISVLPQPSSLPRTRPQTIPKRPALARPRPGRSSCADGPRLSSRRKNASGASTRPIGTFSQKIHCHERPWTTAPPTTGPSATARPPIPPQAPSARPRRSARHRRGEERERERRDDRAAEPLDRPRDVEREDARRERSRGRGDGEDPDPDHEHPPAAEAVAERRAGEEQHGERQRVGVDGPLELAERRVEVAAGSPAAPS